MKKITLILVITISTFTGCQKTQQEAELTDQEFDELYKNIQADALPSDSIVKYKPMAAEADSLSGSQDVPELLSDTPAGCTLPTALSALNSGGGFKVYKFDRSTAAGATAMGFTGSIGRKQMVFIRDFTRYEYVDCGGIKTKVGVGLRCFIHVKSFKGKLATPTLAAIAANVELERAEATLDLSSLGFPLEGADIAEGLPTSDGDYSVENFGKLAVTFDNVLKKLNSTNPMEIRPVKLP